MLSAGPSTPDPVATLIGSIIFVVFAVGFTYLGVRILRNPAPFARFFGSWGSRMWGTRASDRLYRESNLRWAGIGYVIIGPICILAGVYGAAVSLIELLG